MYRISNEHTCYWITNRIVLNARNALYDYRDPRWRIEHAQVVAKEDFDLFNPKIIPSVQPTHATSDMYWLNDRIGSTRAKFAYAYKELLNKSKVIAFGTDFPVEDISPIMTFFSAVVRKDIKGYPDEGFQVENAISRGDALMHDYAVYANFEEDVSKFGFTILNNDLITSPESRIPLTNIVQLLLMESCNNQDIIRCE